MLNELHIKIHIKGVTSKSIWVTLLTFNIC